jgi:signal transduction histidine kinase
MIDSGQHRTIDDLREFSRKVRDAGKRLGSGLAATEIADAPRKGSERANLLAAIEELRVSERKAREEAEAANRAKSDFLALLSHEFRTPLQAIFGYTELLEREIHGPLNGAQRRDLQRIQQSQQHLLGLITAVLDFARLESEQATQGHVHLTAVNEILRNMEGLIGSELEPKELKYQYRCDDEWITARADGAKVQQIVLNLLANAIRFTPPGGSIRLECDREPDAVAIHVIDTGVGIPADKLEAVFEPFVRIRPGNPSSVGTGLGLPISRRLATAMGGLLTATSDFGKGSTFTLRLQKADAAEPTG